ncbi:ankyrin repeat domain-containing protein 12 [Teleopsis dalmanni]|uniref:ankyrin repeat domain-containing protein 12 n=1 Tax=Teleopsis dalmanni TaxID=139649 RepID=UPI0018CD096C|nr:ankyrin repeat domain-containing protein 12 [Teleopsis dalmanni]
MPPPRPRGVGYNTGVANTPMSERQQMALLIQMTATSSSEQVRTHVKKNDHKKTEEVEDNISEKQEGQDSTKDKKTSDDGFVETKKDVNSDHINTLDTSTSSNICKRNYSDVDEDEFEESDDVKKKKRKDSDNGKESKAMVNIRLPGRVEKSIKQTSAAKGSPNPSKSVTVTDKDPSESVKNNTGKSFENDGDDEDCKNLDNIYSGGLKVPPLKIVIPQQNCSLDTDGNVSRTGKINASRNAALPYVVSSSNESAERDSSAQCNSPHESPVKANTPCTATEEKNIKLSNEEKNLQRVLRSSHRSGVTSAERSSNNSSPQMQSSSPSPASLNATEVIDAKVTYNNITTSPLQQHQNFEQENLINLPSPSTSTSSSKDTQTNNVELHPRKRKIRSKNEETIAKPSIDIKPSPEATSTTVTDSHPHDFPFTNCFQMFLNIRRQIEKKWKSIDPVKARPPQGFNEYLLSKRTYLLSENAETKAIDTPTFVPPKMKEIFVIQEKERRELSQRHTVEREKLCLNVEQEIIRVHSKAARNISCQSMPYSVCTLLKDEEVYNVITPEQEEKDRNARNRFNGRLLLSWLQDVDDKYEKIKESMLLRHHNEAESLHAVQLMDWEIALKKYELCDYNTQLVVEKDHVPIVHVSDDFDLLPA